MIEKDSIMGLQEQILWLNLWGTEFFRQRPNFLVKLAENVSN
jgi:hypothetical protein